MAAGIDLTIRIIPNVDFVLRKVHYLTFKKWTDKNRKPNEADFMPQADGLSVYWETYCTIEEVFIQIGIVKKNDKYKNYKEFKVIKFNVGFLRSIKTFEDYVEVTHNPIEGNYAHSLIIYPEHDDEVRVKLCDIVHENYETMVIKPNTDSYLISDMFCTSGYQYIENEQMLT